MKKILRFLKIKKGNKEVVSSPKREDLEQKVVEGAKKAIKEYGRVFERLAEYDRT